MEYFPQPEDDDSGVADVYEINGLLAHTGNSWIEAYPNSAYNHLATQMTDDKEDVYGSLLSPDVLIFLSTRGFRVHLNETVDEELVEWYNKTAMQPFEEEFTAWERENHETY